MRASGTFISQRRGGALALACGAGLALAACGSSSSPASSSGGSGSNTVPTVSVATAFTSDINASMAAVQALTQFATKGANTLQVGVILPDTTSSTRYVSFDAPYLNAAFADAGYTQAQYRIDNAQGSDATELDDATADINLGAKVLVMDPIDNPTGVAIAQLAASKNVTLIAYDRAVFSGHNYYVSFDNEKVGELIGQGLMSASRRGGFRARRSSPLTVVRTRTPTPSRSRPATTRSSGTWL